MGGPAGDGSCIQLICAFTAADCAAGAATAAAIVAAAATTAAIVEFEPMGRHVRRPMSGGILRALRLEQTGLERIKLEKEFEQTTLGSRQHQSQQGQA
jgi:hypothetical protein